MTILSVATIVAGAMVVAPAVADLCPVLAPASGPTVTVDNKAARIGLASNAPVGTTILVSHGICNLGNIIHIANRHLTVRGAGNRADVEDDVGGMLSLLIRAIRIEADGATFADLTIRNARRPRRIGQWQRPAHVLQSPHRRYRLPTQQSQSGRRR